MQNLTKRLDALNRPQLLVQAARSGLATYRRETHLSRAMGDFGHARLVRTQPALERLLDVEHDLNTQRRTCDTGYSYARHIEVLIAIMAESQLLRDGYGHMIAAQ
ncbi:hypothetical protein KO498_10760 [Lentibacter algarum]|uniref:DUF6477 family protein n=1 Tax=Lentibacter algarum TaxID=576131 RepID=UPI001C07D89E|nr:DUF6477 family protein [Lentibacter algarum]MBU2982287.1 hypothetical protein [Lentibacter algarum]